MRIGQTVLGCSSVSASLYHACDCHWVIVKRKMWLPRPAKVPLREPWNGNRVLFRRRKPDGLYERVRTYLWPRRSFSRSLQYFSKRILRLKATPHAVAAGVAAGVFASFFPVGFHFIIAALLCWVIAGNLVAAALGAVFFGNPLTFPLLWETGKLILHDRLPTHGPPAHLGEMLHNLSFAQLWKPVLEPMLIGAVPLGLAFGLLFYALTRWGMNAFREQRRKRLAERASRHAQSSHPGASIGSTAR